MIYATSHINKLFNGSNVHTSKVIEYIDNLLINKLYEDCVELQYSN